VLFCDLTRITESEAADMVGSHKSESSDAEDKPPVAKRIKVESHEDEGAGASGAPKNGAIDQSVVKKEEPDDFESDKDSKSKARQCPYLDTIDRSVLDFDFEKLCSVTLSRINVYACLVCGKYFQGRGQGTHAYIHSVGDFHYVYLNLHTLKFYCLPDNYEIIDSSLDDIKYVLNPTFTKQEIGVLDLSAKGSRSIDGRMYIPGVVGLNNIKANDYCNVVLQALCHVKPLRDYFLQEDNYSGIKRPPGDNAFLLVQRFGELMRKLWNPRNFKSHVSPHEMLQSVVLCSKKQFQITKQGDPIIFLSWFLNALHKALNGTKKANSSIIYKSFLGGMKVFTRKIENNVAEDEENVEETTFLYLTCDLPPSPLFKNELMENIIPQVNLFTLLSKFNGVDEKEYNTYKENLLKRFQITSLPPFIILYVRRFTKNTFFVEKNPTIVNFPVVSIDFGEAFGLGSAHYDLIANIVHEGQHVGGTWRMHLFHKGNNTWYELQDLHVKEILPQMLTLTEPYVQIYQRQE
jgi:U4/U6.U5 tri-snRNP-associated protein 2